MILRSLTMSRLPMVLLTGVVIVLVAATIAQAGVSPP